MKILFITDFFPPETNAAASRVYERALYWLESGHSVTIVTSFPNFPAGEIHEGYKNRWRQVDEMSGLRVVRVKTFVSPNTGRFRRAFDFVSFLLTSFPVALCEDRPDVVVATSPNFFAGVSACLVSMVVRRSFVLEIGDLWPAFIVALDEMSNNKIIWLLEKIELFMYRRSAKVVCLSAAFKRNLVERGVDPNKVSVIRNGAELSQFYPRPAPPELLRRFNPNSKIVIGYLGTLGAAHGLDQFVAAVGGFEEYLLLLVGAGSAKQQLQKIVDDCHIENVTFVPPQPRSTMSEFWALCDVALVHLKNAPMLAGAIPSKIFEAMACGIPVLLVAPPGEASEIVCSTGCGIHVEPGNSAALERGLNLLQDRDLRATLSESGLAASRSYSRAFQASQFIRELNEIHDERSAG